MMLKEDLMKILENRSTYGMRLEFDLSLFLMLELELRMIEKERITIRKELK